MRNAPVGRFEVEDLDQQVRKVIRGLGSPEPPLDLRNVRELLRLDLTFYSSSDTGLLREFRSRIKVGMKQLLLRPGLALDVLRKADVRALCIPDHKRIFIDKATPKLKHRWCETHEICHTIAPWHRKFLFGDSQETLRYDCHAKLEAEANYAAGQLLFLQGRFVAEASDYPRTLQSVRSLAKNFGNTITSTLWRYVEEVGRSVPVLGVVSDHPHHRRKDFDLEEPCKYVIESAAFRERFVVSDTQVFNLISQTCSWKKRGPLGEDQVRMTDRNGKQCVFSIEIFSNSYEVLTLLTYEGPKKTAVAGCATQNNAAG